MRKRDRVAFIGLMVARLGFVIALLLGLAMLGDLIDGGLAAVHMLAGILVAFGVLLATLRFAVLGRAGVPLYVGALLAVFGLLQALEAISVGPQVVHFPVMLVAIGLTEMGAAKSNRLA